MNQTQYTKEQINKAIFEVISTQFKKDAKDSHRIVEESGYDIYKMDGAFHVRNRETGKSIYARYNDYFTKILIYNYNKTASYKIGEVKFDFVNYLEKPKNTAWNEIRYGTSNRFRSQADALHHAKWDIDYHKERIAKIQGQIKSLQSDLIYQAKEQAKAEEHLRTLRKELHLV